MLLTLLGLGVGGSAMTARADDLNWQDASAPSRRPAVTLLAPKATLGKPRPMSDPEVRTAAQLTRPIARGQDGTPAPGGSPLGAPRQLQPPMISEQPPLGSLTPIPSVSPLHISAPVVGPILDPGPILGMDPPADCATCSPDPCADGACFVDNCVGCGGILAPWYGSAEYLLWWVSRNDVPPLVTTGPAASQGIIGMPGTTLLLGGDELLDQQRSGARFRLGRWIGGCRLWAVEGSVFFLEQETENFIFNSLRTPVLARPFFNPNGGVQFAGVPSPGNLSEIVSIPGSLNGMVEVEAKNRFWGAEANLRRNLVDDCRYRFDLLGGFRYLNLEDDLRVTEMIVADPAATDPRFAGFSGVVEDQFSTQNDFYGGQIGFDSELAFGRWSLGMFGKVAFGSTRQRVSIAGSQLFTQNGVGPMFVNGGLLAIPGANIGQYERNAFSVVPEIGVNVGYQVTPRIRLFVGYNFLLWTDVLRSGDQIDPVVDAARVPTFAPPGSVPLAIVRPTVPFKESDFWAQGINFGVNWTW